MQDGMLKKYRQNVELMKRVQAGLLVLCFIALVIYLYIVFQPKVTRYAILDECGQISGSIMHSIKDEDSCRNACYTQYCKANGKYFDKIEFTVGSPGCNTCTCYCKE